MKTKTKTLIIQSLPENVFANMDNIGNTGRFIAFFFAPIYANWCLNNMLADSKKILEATTKN